MSEATAHRTHALGSLSESNAGTSVRLCGWVHRRRDLGGLVFVDLRDRYGTVQISLGPDWTDEASMAVANRLGLEDVVQVEGTVALRPGDARNEDLATGAIEVQAGTLTLLNGARTPRHSCLSRPRG